MPSHQAVAVENAGDQVIAGGQHQLPDGCDDIGGGRITLATSPMGWSASLGAGWITSNLVWSSVVAYNLALFARLRPT